jgi:hypothetical protein
MRTEPAIIYLEVPTNLRKTSSISLAILLPGIKPDIKCQARVISLCHSDSVFWVLALKLLSVCVCNLLSSRLLSKNLKIKIYNFTRGFVWVCNLVADIEGGTQAEGV